MTDKLWHFMNFILCFLIYYCRSDNIDLVEKVLSIYNMALTDHSFVLDYQNQFKVERDLELMRQACLKMSVD